MADPGCEAAVSDFSTLIFLHIPRTGGTTLQHVLEHQIAAADIFAVDSRDVAASMTSLAAMSRVDRSHLKLVSGHLDYGVHDLLPSPSQYVTFVREPVSRLISCYGQISRSRRHRLHDAVRDGSLSFGDFLRSGVDWQTDNGQVRQVAGCLYTLEFGACGRSHLELAKEHIEERFLLVGTVEKYDEALVTLSSLLGWQRIATIPRNTNSKTESLAEVSDALRREIIERNVLDIELYEFVGVRLAEVFRTRPSLSRELRRFQLVTSPFRALAPVERIVRRARDRRSSRPRP